MINTDLMLDFLRFVIRVRNYKQKDLANTIGVSRSHLSELLVGKKELSLKMFCEIADAVHLKPHTLLAIGAIKSGFIVPDNFKVHVSTHELNLIRLYVEINQGD
jgi:transcriptional regulator with XRE-family HTH domain